MAALASALEGKVQEMAGLLDVLREQKEGQGTEPSDAAVDSPKAEAESPDAEAESADTEAESPEAEAEPAGTENGSSDPENKN